MLDGSSVLWGNAPYLTLSFTPDGTDAAGQPSQLFATMNEVDSAEQWQTAVLDAFQTWTRHTNADVGLVADQGLPLGTAGPTRGDARFGDIRVAAVPMSPDTLAVSIPHDQWMSGSFVGDLLFNSEAQFSSIEDIYAISLHEAGHILGLDHSDDPLSPMFHHGIPLHTQLTSGDITSIQSLFGMRIPDAAEREQGSNDSFALATRLRAMEFYGQDEGAAPSVAVGDVTTADDVDFYRLDALSDYLGPVTIQVRTGGISALVPKLSVYNRDRQLLDEAAGVSPTDGEISIQLDQRDADERYYLRVAAADSDHAIGGYVISATFEGRNQASLEQLLGQLGHRLRFLDEDQIQDVLDADDDDHFNDDEHSDDDEGDEAALEVSDRFAPGVRFDTLGSIADASDVDRYKLTSPDAGSESLPAMSIIVSSLEAGGLIPSVQVSGEDHRPMSLRTLTNGNGELLVVVDGVQPDREYYIEVGAADGSWPFNTGNYEMVVMFSPDGPSLDSFAGGTLWESQPTFAQSLYLSQPQLFHFVLDAQANDSPAGGLIVASLLDADGIVRFQLATAAGQTRSASSPLLLPGEYQWQVVAIATPQLVPPSIDWSLRGSVLTRPIGALPNDPTAAPAYKCPDASGEYCYPDGSRSTDSYWWGQQLAQLPDVPRLSGPSLIDLLLGQWWEGTLNRDPANNPATAKPDHYRVDAGVPSQVGVERSVLRNDVDSNNDPTAAWLDTTTTHGSVSLQPDGSFTYLPEPGYVGTDSFTYRVYDFQMNSTPATVYLDVGLDAPPAVASLARFQFVPDPADLSSGRQPSSWSRQRSTLDGIRLEFREPVNIRVSDVHLFVMRDAQPSQEIPLIDSQLLVDSNVVTLDLRAAQLPDGVYQLELAPTITDLAGQPLDGDGDQMGGDAQIVTGSLSNGLFKLTADWNGDAGVSIFDFATLAYWFGQPSGDGGIAPQYVDLNGDGRISIFDLVPLVREFNSSLTFPAASLADASNRPGASTAAKKMADRSAQAVDAVIGVVVQRRTDPLWTWSPRLINLGATRGSASDKT